MVIFHSYVNVYQRVGFPVKPCERPRRKKNGGRGDNPRLRQEATEAQEAEDTLRRRLVELTQRLVELKESCRNTNGTGRYWKKIMAV